jgi:hypothetical protein
VFSTAEGAGEFGGGWWVKSEPLTLPSPLLGEGKALQALAAERCQQRR